MSVPFLDLNLHDTQIRAEIDAVLKSLLDTATYIGGEQVNSFAQEFARFCGAQHCVPVANGTDALILALKALNIGPGDEVITVPYTFIATAEAISAVGAQVKFVDIERKTYTIDIASFEKKITPKTKAVIAVHLYGQVCDMDPLRAVAKKHNIAVIEDAAQAHGAEYKGKRAGSLGDIACFSFYPTKNLGGFGDGGAVTTNSAELAKKVTQIANHGRTEQYFHAVEGLNSRLDAMQAGILRVLLKRLDSFNERRRRIAARYDETLKGNSWISIPTVASYAKPVYHLYCVESPKRAQLIDHLKKNNIGNGVYYPLPLHLQPAYARLKHQKGDFPNSEAACESILSLPMFAHMTDAQIDEVCAALKSFRP